MVWVVTAGRCLVEFVIRPSPRRMDELPRPVVPILTPRDIAPLSFPPILIPLSPRVPELPKRPPTPWTFETAQAIIRTRIPCCDMAWIWNFKNLLAASIPASTSWLDLPSSLSSKKSVSQCMTKNVETFLFQKSFWVASWQERRNVSYSSFSSSHICWKREEMQLEL